MEKTLKNNEIIKIIVILSLFSLIISCFGIGNVTADPQKIWGEEYDGGKTDKAFSVAVDSQNRIIVTGYTVIVNYEKCCTVRYNSDGTQDIVIIYNTYERSRSLGVAIDSEDNIIITGYINNLGYYDIITIKYDSSGNELWNQTYDSTDVDIAYDVTVDSNDNIIIVARLDDDYITIKYDSSGNKLWDKKIQQTIQQPRKICKCRLK